MLFNSTLYLFAFLPAVLVAYYIVSGTRLQPLRRPLLIVATLVFYGLGGWRFVPLLIGSVVFNYAIAWTITRLAARPVAERLVLAIGIAGNVVPLFYFKYFNFILTSANAAFDAHFMIERIILPLGISFFTFQQIGFLVDLTRKRITLGSPLDYATWVLFFPQILAGPIVLYRETAPQLAAQPERSRIGANILIGIAILSIGLFKKTVIADTFALYASPVYRSAREAHAIGFLDTWIGAFAYTGQVYFDFSGYSDMAIGTARMFGILLPLNFHSPLRSASIVEIWRRWHITLGRWVQSYVFQPISMPLARLAAVRGAGKYGMLVASVLVPTMISMLIVGVWHGAGWPFVVFGLMQGLYMVVNETWAAVRKKSRKKRGPAPGWHRPLAGAATLVAFVLTLIPFGSPDLASAGRMFAAMTGASGGIVLPPDWPIGLPGAVIVMLIGYTAIYLVPNTQQIMGRFEPVLEWERWQKMDAGPLAITWRMTVPWMFATALVFFLGFALISRGTTQFIYFNF